MSEPRIQPSFNAGEWSPKLYARVDLAKYRSGAALLENYFVDYRGGASTRPGTKYILQAYKSNTIVRLIPFQATFDLGYVLEFGDGYIRFFIDGAPVLEAAKAVTSVSIGNPSVFTSAGHGYINGNWILAGDGQYYIVADATANTYTLTTLGGVAVTTNPFASLAISRRVYIISSPYTSTELALLKYAQNVNVLIICHPDHPPYNLTLNTVTNWTLTPIVFGSTVGVPTITNLIFNFATGVDIIANYSYVVTAVDVNGQESSPSASYNAGPAYDLKVVAGTIQIEWTAVPGAVSYNIYRANISYNFPVPAGAAYGYQGSSDGTAFTDSNIAPDFSITPPIARAPFNNANGLGVDYVVVTGSGTYGSVPNISFTGAASSVAASAAAVLGVLGTPAVASGGTGHAVDDRVVFTNGTVFVVAAVVAGVITAWKPISDPQANQGSVTAGTVPANPLIQLASSGAGIDAQANAAWGVTEVNVTIGGAGYTSTPNVTFSAGTATATAVLAPASAGYPTVPSFFQQRLVLAAPTGAPQTFYMSQPGIYYNFNVSNPIQATDAITGSLVSGQLNTIKSMLAQTSGFLILTDKASWLVNGGSAGSAVSPSAIVANPQSFNGASDVPPIIANFDVLYVQSKGSIVRDSSYNIYANVFTGTDISVISSHLFYGHTVTEWAWAEEPFKVLWCVRDDGVLLLLTFLKEQEFIGWTHAYTNNGSFKSVATVTEGTTTGTVDAVYTVVERIINGFVVKYIERVAERDLRNGVEDAWCVDAGLQYNGTPATVFSGGNHLAGQTVTGLADGVIIPAFVMPITGSFTLATPASKVTVGIGYNCDLQTLAIDLGEPTVQGKVKSIPDVTVRVSETLGLSIGPDFNHLVPMKDLICGNVSKMLTGQESQIITGLVDGDANTILGGTYTVPGQYCIRQSNPYPASVLGVIPNIRVGDSK